METKLFQKSMLLRVGLFMFGLVSVAFANWDRIHVGGGSLKRYLWDVNNDGYVDSLTLRNWYKNPGTKTGNWEAIWTGWCEEKWNGPYQVGHPDMDKLVDGVRVGDINGDGLPDMVVGTYGDDYLGGVPVPEHMQDSIYVAINPGNEGEWSFYYIGTLPATEDGVETVAIGDMNKDGYPDILAGGECKCVYWFVNPGYMTNKWSYYILYDGGIRDIDGMVIRDFNNDTYLDIAIDTCDPIGLTGGIYVLINPQAEQGNWTSILVDGGRYSCIESISAGDINGDGWNDIVLTNRQPGKSSCIYWYENPRGAGSWTRRMIDTVGGALEGSPPEVADIDLDGNPDVICSRPASGETYWYKNLGGGSNWLKTKIWDIIMWYYAIGDVDNDGDTDIIVGGYWYVNPTDKTFLVSNEGQICYVKDITRDTATGEITNTGDLYVKNLSTGKLNQITDFAAANPDGAILNPQFTSDGSEILFTYSTDPATVNFSVYLTSTNSTLTDPSQGKLSFLPDGNLKYAALSPDYDGNNGFLAYTYERTDKTELMVYNFNTRLSICIVNQQNFEIKHPVFIDNETIAFVGITNRIQDIYTVKVDGSSLTNLTNNSPTTPQYGRLLSSMRNPGIPPMPPIPPMLIYSKRVWQGYNYGKWDIYIRRISGTECNVTNTFDIDEYDPAFFGDGTTTPPLGASGQMFYAATLLSDDDIWQANYDTASSDTNTSQTQRATQSNIDFGLPNWSPVPTTAVTDYVSIDQTRFVYSDGNNIYRANYDGSNTLQLTNYIGGSTGTDPNLARNGGTIVFTYTGATKDISKMNHDGTENTPFAPADGLLEIKEASISPDGRWVVYAKQVGANQWDVVARSIVYCAGVHTGVNDSPILIDSTKSWVPNSLVGVTVYNLTDGSSGVITANTSKTITAVLAGGVDNDWDMNDVYRVGDEITIDNNGGAHYADIESIYFNPDMTKIVYSVYGQNGGPNDASGPGDWDIVETVYIVVDDIAGTITPGISVNITRTPTSKERYPSFSNDGRKIIFVSDMWDNRDQIFTMGGCGSVDEGVELVVADPTDTYTFAYPIYGPVYDSTNDADAIAYIKNGEIYYGYLPRSAPPGTPSGTNPVFGETSTSISTSGKFGWGILRTKGEVIGTRRYLPDRAAVSIPLEYEIIVDVDEASVPSSFTIKEIVPDTFASTTNMPTVNIDGTNITPKVFDNEPNNGLTTIKIVFSPIGGDEFPADHVIRITLNPTNTGSYSIKGEISFMLNGQPTTSNIGGNSTIDISAPFLPVDIYDPDDNAPDSTGNRVANGNTQEPNGIIEDYDLLYAIDCWKLNKQLPGYGPKWPSNITNWDNIILAIIDIWATSNGDGNICFDDNSGFTTVTGAGGDTQSLPGEYVFIGNQGGTLLPDLYDDDGADDPPVGVDYPETVSYTHLTLPTKA